VNVYPVSAVLTYLRELIESDFMLSDLWVAGEVSNYNRTAAGHSYFSLKDGAAALRCVLFASRNPGSDLKNGDEVLAHGRISLYEVRGELQLVVDFVRPKGIGELAAQFELLKERLEEEGLFDPARKRPLPRFPKRIGVVTSPSGAVFHDICRVVGRRWPVAEIVFAPAAVQGDLAAAQIVSALRRIQDEDVEIIIVGRGGGSLEELWPFNEESVARAIYGSLVPTVSAVGHETDFTIADFVADVRAPTPSAAAELVTPDRGQLLRDLDGARERMHRYAFGQVGAAARDLAACQARLWRERPRPGEIERAIDRAVLEAVRNLRRGMLRQDERLEAADERLRALSPLATLGRGYAIVQRVKDGKVVARLHDVKGGAGLQVSVSDGAFWAEVS
jgi:exodeoxyribonuclease VII large subunit